MDLAGWMEVSDLAHFYVCRIINTPEKYQTGNILLVQCAQGTVAGRAEGIFESKKIIGSIWAPDGLPILKRRKGGID